MSYILDALRKAERDRARGRVPTLATADVLVTQERRLWPWLGGGAAALLAGLTVWYALSPPPEPPGPPPAPPARPAPEVRPAPPPSPRPGKAATPASPPSRRLPAPPATAQAPPPAAAAPLAPQLVGPVEDLSPARAGKQAPPPAPAPAEAKREADPPPAPAPAPPVRPPDAVAALPPAATAAPPAAPPAGQVREAMEKLHLNILVYSDIPAERMVSIEGRQYVEGQQVQGKYLVESITPDGAVLSAGGERVLLQPRPAPFRRP
jgi:general secretion pathway protein B